MRVLFLHEHLRTSGVNFIRGRYLLADLEERGHSVRLASFIADERSDVAEDLEHDIISVEEVAEFDPDVLLIELGAFSCGQRIPSRDFLNGLKANGCIVLHCGLDVNEYRRARDEYDEMFRGFACGINGGTADQFEQPNIRGEDGGQRARTSVATLRDYCAIRDPAVFEGIEWVETIYGLPLWPSQQPLLVAGDGSWVKAYRSLDLHGDGNAVYGTFNDHKGIEILITGHFVTDGDSREEGLNNRRFLLNVLEWLHDHHPTRWKTSTSETRTPTRVIISYAWQDNQPNANGVGKIDAVVQSLRDRQVLVDRDVEVFRAGYMPIDEWSKRLPHVDKAIFLYSSTWAARPAPEKELAAAEREADRRFIKAREQGLPPEPFILFFTLDDTPVPERHRSYMYRSLSGLSFADAIEAIYRDIVGREGSARAYDLAGYKDFVF